MKFAKNSMATSRREHERGKVEGATDERSPTGGEREGD